MLIKKNRRSRRIQIEARKEKIQGLLRRRSSSWTFISRVMAVLKTYKAKVLKMIKSMIRVKSYISKIKSREVVKIRKEILQTLMKSLEARSQALRIWAVSRCNWEWLMTTETTLPATKAIKATRTSQDLIMITLHPTSRTCHQVFMGHIRGGVAHQSQRKRSVTSQ